MTDRRCISPRDPSYITNLWQVNQNLPDVKGSLDAGIVGFMGYHKISVIFLLQLRIYLPLNMAYGI